MSIEVLCWPHPSRDGNPYLSSLYDAMRSRGAETLADEPQLPWRRTGNVWHIHWPEQYLNARRAVVAAARSARLLAAILVAKSRGTAIAWTAHNLRAHERRHPVLERIFWAAFTRLVDGTIFMSEASRTAAFTRYPALASKPACVIPHGHYREAYPPPPARVAAQRQVNYTEDVDLILSFGQVRDYKNIPSLVAAFAGVASEQARLLIAGACYDPKLAARITADAAADRRVSARLQYVAHEETPAFLRAATLMCLPYVEPLNSGAAILSLSFGVPCLMTDAPASRELQARVGHEWLRLFSGPLTADVLADALDWARRQRSSEPDMRWCDWQTIAESTLSFFTSLVDADRAAAAKAIASRPIGSWPDRRAS